MREQIEQLIDDLSDAWDFEDPMPAEELTKVAKLGALPDELRAFYERAGGASIGSVDIFTSDELLDVNKRRPKALAKAAFFASDGADGFFFIDAGNALKKGSSSVYWIERGTTGVKGAVYCAPELVVFLRTVAAGNQPWISSSLGAVEVSTMTDKLKAAGDRWKPRPGAGWPVIKGAGKRVNTFLGEALEQLLLVADGFEIPGVGVTVRDAASLEGVTDTYDAEGHPNAVWFAADTRGNGYAVIPVADWRGAEADDVIRIASGQSPNEAPIIGSLPAVVVAWLEGKQP